MADQPTSPTPPADASAAQRLDLARRLLAMTYHCDTSLLRLLPGRPPDDLLVTLPLPEDVRILGALTVAPPDLPTGHAPPLAIILVETPHTVEQGARRLSAALEAQGWSQNIVPPHMRGGFVHVMPNYNFMRFGLAASDYVLTISPLASASEQPTTFSISVGQESAPPPQRRRDYIEQRELIPTLLPPAGATQQSGGGGGGSGRRYMHAYLSTDAPIAEVMATYDRQLERAGWQRRSGGASGSVGWSYWTFTDEGKAWRGALAVLGDPDRPRDSMAFIQIETDGDDGSEFASWKSHAIISG